jgi:hypothetical protein
MRCSNCLKNKIYIETDPCNKHHIRCNTCGLDIIYDTADPFAQMVLLQYDIEKARELARIDFHSGNDGRDSPYKKEKDKRNSLLAWEWENAWEIEKKEQDDLAYCLSAEKIKKENALTISKKDDIIAKYKKVINILWARHLIKLSNRKYYRVSTMRKDIAEMANEMLAMLKGSQI